MTIRGTWVTESVAVVRCGREQSKCRCSPLRAPGDIKAVIKAATKAQGVIIAADDAKAARPHETHYANSLALLQDTYNNPAMPESVRQRAAEQALPYEPARMGEVGKKEKAKDRAHAIAGQRSKFTPKSAPPQLRVVPKE